MDRNDLLRAIALTTAALTPLLTQYEDVVKGAKNEAGEARPFNHEEWTKHEALGKEINNLSNQLASHRAALKAIDLSNDADERTAQHLGLSNVSKLPNSGEAYMDAFGEFVRGGCSKEAAKNAFSGPEFANLSTVSPSTGGVLIPTEIEKAILFEAFAESPLLSLSEVMMTSSIHTQIPFMGTIGLLAPRKEMEAYLKTEPDLSVKAIDIFNYGGLFPISQELMDDAEGLTAAFSTVFGNAFAETVEEYGLKGTGGQTAFVDQAGDAATVTLSGRVCPGILTQSTGIVPAVANGATTAITADDIIKLKQVVKPTARTRGVYLVGTDFETKALLLKDSTGQPIWRPNLIAGQPSMLNGSPYHVSDRLDAVAASKTPALFGDFKRGHQIKIRKGLVIGTSGHYLFGNGAIAVKGDVRWGALVKYKNYIGRLNTPAS